MQQVLNSQDRTQSFIKFLVFFLVTILLVVLAIFINYKLPSQENKRLREQAELQRQQDANEMKFMSSAQEAVSLLDSMEKGGLQMGQIKNELDGKLSDLYKLQESDNTIYGKLNKLLVGKLSELEAKKVNMNDMADKLSKSASLQADLDKCSAALEDAKRTNDALRPRTN